MYFRPQHCRDLINHWQRCGKQQARVMLVHRCPPCLLVKGTTAVQRKRLMCSGHLPLNKITSLQTYNVCTLKPNKYCETEGKLPCCLSNSPAQEDLCIQYCLFAEPKHTRHIVCKEQFIKTLLQSLYWLSVFTRSKECQWGYSRGKIQESVWNEKYPADAIAREEWYIYHHPSL